VDLVLKLLGRGSRGGASRAGGELDHSWVAAARVAAGTIVGAIVMAGTLAGDAAATARLAQAEDLSRAAADVVLLSASVASLVAVGFLLVDASHHTGSAKGLLIALAIVTGRSRSGGRPCGTRSSRSCSAP
jgi:hypothetical protein